MNIKLSRELSNGIVRALESLSREEIVRYHVDGWIFPEGAEMLRKLPLDTLIEALYVGYVPEKTPAEKLVEYIEKERETSSRTIDPTEPDNRIKGALKAAEILGVDLPI